MGFATDMRRAAALSVGAAMLATGLGLQPAVTPSAMADTTAVSETTASAYDIVTVGSAKVVKFRNNDDTRNIKSTIDGTAQDGAVPNYWQLVTRIGLKVHLDKALKAGDVAYVRFNTTETSRFRSFSPAQAIQPVKDANGDILFNVEFSKTKQRLELTATDAGAKLATADFTVDLKFNCWPPSSGGGSDSEKDFHTEWTIGSSTITFDNTPLTKKIGYDARYVNGNGSDAKRVGVSSAFETGGLINTAVNDATGTRAWQAQADKKRIFLMKITPKTAPIAKVYVSAIASSMRVAYDETHTSNGDATGQISEAAKEITVGSADAINTVDKAATLLKKNEYAVYHATDGVWWFACNVGSSSEDTTTLANLKDDATTTLYQKAKSLGLGAQIRIMYAYMEFSNDQTAQSATVEWSNSYGQSGTLDVKNTILSNETADGVKLGWIGFEPNGGTGTMDTKAGAITSKLTLPANGFTRTGYEFAGWNTQKDGKGAAYKAGDQLQYPEAGVTLYAQWKGLPATITVHANEGSGEDVTISGMTGKTVKTPAADTFVRPGYTLKEWNTKQDGSGIAYAPGTDMPMPAGDTGLYAIWKAAPASVTYDANGGSGTTGKTTGVTDQTVKTAANAFTRTGYRFDSWNTKPDGTGVKYATGADVRLPAGGVTLYAQWTGEETTVTYASNNGAGDTVKTQAVTGGTVKAGANTFERAGYTFTGWNTKTDGTGAKYAAGADVPVPVGGITLYAQWKAAPAAISYDANGGAGATGKTTGVTDGTVKAAASGFTRAGYTFDSWNTKPDGTGVKYAPNADVKLPAGGITLYARWTASPAAVTYDANKGTGTTGKTTGVTDQTVKAAASAFARTGYSFDGWNTKADGTGAKYAPNADVKLPAGGITLYAQWKALPASVSYDANGGKGTTAKTTGVTDGTVKTAASTMLRDGYSFTGWNTRADGKGDGYQPGATLTLPAGGVTLYAQWKANTETVTFNPNGANATGFTDPLTGPRDSTAKLPANGFAYAGYSFTGWNTRADGTGTAIADKAPFTFDGTRILYAQWKANPAPVTLNANGGTGENTILNAVTGMKITLPTNGFTRDGYTTSGWNTKPDGSGTAYAAGATIQAPANGVTLYAQWTALKAAIAYNANNGTGSMPDTTGVTGQTVKASDSTFTRDGWKFAGWNTKADGSGDTVKPGMEVTLAATPIILYAQWKADDMTIRYDANASDATGTMIGQTLADAADGKAMDAGYARDGYEFTGWNTSRDGKGVAYAPGDRIHALPGGALTLYAQWKALPATVGFDANAKDATGSTRMLTGVTGDRIRIPANGYRRAGWTFTGWNTREDGKGTAYRQGDEITLKGSITLHAQWTRNPDTSKTGGNTGKTAATGGKTGGDAKTGLASTGASTGIIALTGMLLTGLGLMLNRLRRRER
ncbi:InlB B-repeat-containing protein [Bifidobacterium sp. SO1]|uniref:InlB B-repeat-containing protein n=1 Tax=Bifidobacterium sp. SO1 TaxID=2809029 RepID=UPI001BDC586E|nr:InlB B-repeat-containing protein [Bifidobacterium sp. SO1]MBT1161810.1 InlB B-repeat-containing protein [Bifidobacterium sp. SO1]